MNKKAIIVFACIIVLVVLLFPVRFGAKDGGTVIYKSVICEYDKIHRYSPNFTEENMEFEIGSEFKVFGHTVYKNTHYEISEESK